jgi:cytochrome c biogenesis protein CcdA/thiol-disulfide isomerase/thioredoxin
MVLLVLTAFAVGVVTSLTPCILPVLPIILVGGGTSETKRRPYAIVAGIVTTFTVFTLAGTWIFRQLGLSPVWQTRVGVGLLLLLAVTLVVPAVGRWFERPFLFLTRRRGGDLGGGFLLGASLGLVFVPCATVVLATVTANAARERVGFSTVIVALAYALGTAVPMILIAHGGRALAGRFRAHALQLRVAMGVVMALAAVAIYQGWETSLQTKVPGVANSVIDWFEGHQKNDLASLAGRRASAAELPGLADYGRAPRFSGIEQWLNTRGGKPPNLRHKVVLVDFWTYSCINCLRTLPHLKAWDAAYRKAGLVIVGVHTPEFAFEHVPSNVHDAVKRFGIRYPVAIDNGYKTWDAYSNNYWPAEYLIDRNGHVRHHHFGEGEYGTTEQLIRELLAERSLPKATPVADTTPNESLTPESYLGYGRLDPYRYAGGRLVKDGRRLYQLPSTLPQDAFAYGGVWRVEAERATAGAGARLRLHFGARNVFLVLSGHGRLHEFLDGKPQRTIQVGGLSRLYTLLRLPSFRSGLLELNFTPGISAYAFTFG